MSAGLVFSVDHFSNASFGDADITLDPDTFACPLLEIIPTLKVKLAILFSTFTLGVIGNVSVLVMVCSHPYQRSSLDLYLVNLAVNDLLSAFSRVLWAISAKFGWIIEHLGCKVFSVLSTQSLNTGVLLLGGLCMHWLKRINNHLLCICAWVFGFLLALPEVLFSHTSRLSSNILMCHQQKGRPLQLPFNLFINLIGFAIPPLLFLLVSLTHKCLRNTDSKKKRKRHLLLSLTLAFAVFRSPFHICGFIKTMMREKMFEVTCQLMVNTDRATSIALMLSYCHCFVNPILYCLFWRRIGEYFH